MVTKILLNWLTLFASCFTIWELQIEINFKIISILNFTLFIGDKNKQFAHIISE